MSALKFAARVLKDSADPAAALTAVAKTATFNSEGFVPKADIVGLFLDIDTVSGTSPTLNIKGQVSFDGGTTWLDTFPDDFNSQTQIVMDEITATTETGEYWKNPFGPIVTSGAPGEASSPQIRFVFTIAGTSPSFTFTNAYVVEKSFS